jgi:hypothetical protein
MVPVLDWSKRPAKVLVERRIAQCLDCYRHVGHFESENRVLMRKLGNGRDAESPSLNINGKRVQWKVLWWIPPGNVPARKHTGAGSSRELSTYAEMMFLRTA